MCRSWTDRNLSNKNMSVAITNPRPYPKKTRSFAYPKWREFVIRFIFLNRIRKRIFRTKLFVANDVIVFRSLPNGNDFLSNRTQTKLRNCCWTLPSANVISGTPGSMFDTLFSTLNWKCVYTWVSQCDHRMDQLKKGVPYWFLS